MLRQCPVAVFLKGLFVGDVPAMRAYTQGLRVSLKVQAAVAQVVEQRIRNAWVGGSSPSSSTTQQQNPLWPSPFMAKPLFIIFLQDC
jgi:hypothetical protein